MSDARKLIILTSHRGFPYINFVIGHNWYVWEKIRIFLTHNIDNIYSIDKLQTIYWPFLFFLWMLLTERWKWCQRWYKWAAHVLEIKAKNFINRTGVAERRTAIGRFCDQSGTSIHIIFVRARSSLKPYCCFACVSTNAR